MLWADPVFAWMALARTPALDVAALCAALAELGGIDGLIGSSAAARQRAGIPPAACEYLSSALAAPSAAERAWTENPRHHLLPFTDPRYPVALGGLERGPIALYVVGQPQVLNDPQLSIVGSRNPTAAGRDTAFAFAESLAACGLGITSGLAEGIDSAAHRGALAAQGVTIAVLGSGVDVVYPRSNKDLAARIHVQGALISEFPLGTPPRRGNFPQRNRLIAALSLGTLVVEAARRSGSLITARFAGDQNRELFAIPGSIHNPLSRGCHELIRQGAKLTETAADILTELNFSHFFDEVRRASDALAPAPGIEAGMDKEHKILLDALGFDPADLDMLVVRTGFKPEAVSSMMLILELEGHVQAAPGGRYSRVFRSRR
ncbi:MAG TPA: DNA-processing protein DprA [Steroidobacteraceae bacterium]|jgi:DNA processing protein|nr:DNA-processing protein DprA [Steroidobacteraceae bacterium]